MIRMTVKELLEACGATLVAGSADVSFEDVTIDSRRVRRGGCFVAFVGERTDGNDYVAQAFSAGASLVVMTRPPSAKDVDAATSCGAALVRAADDDGEALMLALARAWRDRNPQWLVVGVTGSCGKTTTKELLAAGIGAQRRCHATSGNLNNLLGVPLTLLSASKDDEVLVVEMGMNNAGEISRIAQAARPVVAVITNVGTSHIGNLGSRENIARAKAEVTGGLKETAGVSRALVLTATDDFTDFIEREFARPSGVGVVRVGDDGSHVWVDHVTLDDAGLPTFSLHMRDRKDPVRMGLSLPGTAAVADFVSALAAISALGLDADAALPAMSALRPTRMRLEVKGGGDSCRVIDDSYNASPASMAASLDVLCALRCEGRRIAVLGEMGELGDEAPRLHAMVAAYAAAKRPDVLAFVGGSLADAMRDAALTMGYPDSCLRRFADAHEAAAALAPTLTERDVMLVKASRAVGLDRLVEEVLG